MPINVACVPRATWDEAEEHEKGTEQPTDAVGSCLHMRVLCRPLLKVELFEPNSRKVTVDMVCI